MKFKPLALNTQAFLDWVMRPGRPNLVKNIAVTTMMPDVADVKTRMLKAEELVYTLSTAVTGDVNAIAATVFAHIVTYAGLHKCAKGHPNIYYLANDCPICNGRLKVFGPWKDEPVIVGKIFETERLDRALDLVEELADGRDLSEELSARVKKVLDG